MSNITERAKVRERNGQIYIAENLHNYEIVHTFAQNKCI